MERIDPITAHALDALSDQQRADAARLARARQGLAPLAGAWEDLSPDELASATLEAANWLAAARTAGITLTH
jgi:hypothetical protein